MRRLTNRQRLLTMTALGVTLLGGLAVLRTDAQTTDRYNPVRAAYMRAHFHQVLLMHDAVARGDLAEAKKQAALLAAESPSVPMPPGAEAFRGALTQAAREAGNAATLADAAQATASMLGTCGQCHKANQVRATVPPGKAPGVGGLVGHMLLHQKGADDLLEGLVAPSESQWVEGVRVFASPKLEAKHVPGKMRKTMAHGESELAGLAGRAAQAHRTRDRAEIYGELLTTCGTCHRGHSRFAGPDRR